MEETKIAVLTDGGKIEEELRVQLHHLGYKNTEWFTEVTPFFSYIDETPNVIMVLSCTGAYSVEIAMNLRDRSASNPLIWFSDLDFGVVSYRVHASWFGMMPVTEEALKRAFHRVLH